MTVFIIVLSIIGICTILAFAMIADLANRIKKLEEKEDRSNTP